MIHHSIDMKDTVENFGCIIAALKHYFENFAIITYLFD